MDVYPAINGLLNRVTLSLAAFTMSTHQRIRAEFGQNLSEQQMETIEEVAKRRYPNTPIESVLSRSDFKSFLFTQFPEFDPDIAQAV